MPEQQDDISDFDPYYSWLGIRSGQRPPDHYGLLGIARFEQDVHVIANAADRQSSHIRSFRLGKQAHLCERLLNELSAAHVCLLNPGRKAAYDAQLRSHVEARGSAGVGNDQADFKRTRSKSIRFQQKPRVRAQVVTLPRRCSAGRVSPRPSCRSPPLSASLWFRCGTRFCNTISRSQAASLRTGRHQQANRRRRPTPLLSRVFRRQSKCVPTGRPMLVNSDKPARTQDRRRIPGRLRHLRPIGRALEIARRRTQTL